MVLKSVFTKKNDMKKLLWTALGIALISIGCVKKPDAVPVGEAKVRFVNAAQGSVLQDVYLNGAQIQTPSLAYRVGSPYVSYTSGFNVFAFANYGTQIANARVDYGTSIGSHATIFFYKTLANTYSAEPIGDDTSSPAAGKFKVRFIHLNDHVRNFIKVSNSNVDLFPSLNFRAASNYFEFEPGAKFVANATGVSNSPEFTINGVAGKVYTVWFSGEDEKQLVPNILTHN